MTAEDMARMLRAAQEAAAAAQQTGGHQTVISSGPMVTGPMIAKGDITIANRITIITTQTTTTKIKE